MASIIQIVNSVQLTGSAALLYTSPAGVWTQIMKLSAKNTDTSVRVITLYLVPSGGSALTATIITGPQGIFVGATFNDPNVYGQVLNPGDALWGFADVTAKVNVFASGLLSTLS